MVTINNSSVNITVINCVSSKECSMCKLMKPLIEYSKDRTHSDGYRSSCKACRNPRQREEYIRNKETYKNYNEKNRERIAERMKKYGQDNREKINEYNRKYQNEKYHSDEQTKLKMLLHSRLNKALKRNKMSEETCELIGCSLSFFKEWLESQFNEAMSFENYGTVWEAEHVRPCASFDLTVLDEQKRCFNWQNTQVLTPKDNKIKGTKRNIELEAAHALKAQMFLNK